MEEGAEGLGKPGDWGPRVETQGSCEREGTESQFPARGASTQLVLKQYLWMSE